MQLQLHPKCCGEVLPYLEIKRQEETEETIQNVEMPNVTEMEVEEAKKLLKEIGLEIEINGEGKIVTDQLPKKGIQVSTGTKVTVYAQ